VVDMIRNENHVWEDTVPIGTYDIIWAHGIGGYPWANGHILFVCPNGMRCGGLIGKEPHDKDETHQCYTWGFNGNLDKPTLTPSFNCVGGCGWHGFITDGVMK
jgi:hypothetical protein